MSVLLFDFVGCGNSTGEFVTLGLNEAIDLKAIIQHLKTQFKIESIYLWGRSMGSSTILNYLFNIRLSTLLYKENYKVKRDLQLQLNEDPFKEDELVPQINRLTKNNRELKQAIKQKHMIHAVVIDSSFTCAKKMVKDVMRKRMKTSKFITSVASMYLKNSIKNHTKVDVLGKNKPSSLVRYLTVPAVFMVGDQDDLVDLKEFKQMFDDYNAEDKKFRILQNTSHSDGRKEEDIEFVINFIKFIEEKNRPTEKSIFQFKD